MAGWNGIFDDGFFGCGFDMSPTAAQIFNQAAAGVASATTPFGTGFSWQLGGNTAAGKLLNVNLTTLLVGWRMFSPGLPASSQIIATWFDATANAAQVTLRVFSDGHFAFFRGSGVGTQLGPSSAIGLFNVSTWIWLEAKVVMSTTVGFVELRINGTTAAITSLATLNTQSTANLFVNAFQLTGIVANTNFDDWYMLDMTGAAPFNTYLGNIRARFDVPNANSAAGGHNQFTPTNPTNVNFSNVGNIPGNVAQFNADGTVGDLESYRFPAIPGTPASVLVLNEWYSAILDTAGVRTLLAFTRSGGTDFFDTLPVQPPNGAPYALIPKPWVKDPNTGAAWTVVNAGNCELGVKINS